LALSFRVGTAILLGILSVPGVCRAQSQTQSPDAQRSPIADEVRGTPVKKTPAPTDDAIALLAPRPAANPAETLATDAAARPAAKETAEAPQDPEQRKVEMAALQQQIKEKQRRIQLLMRMFVLDEQTFLKDTSGNSENDEARAKRRFEQEELLREGKEVARLQARLDSLAAANSGKVAPPAGVLAN
jgi:type IV secretory pathway VirB10-like protein